MLAVAALHGQSALFVGGVLTAVGALFAAVGLLDLPEREILRALGVISLAFGALLGIYPIAYQAGAKIYWSVLLAFGGGAWVLALGRLVFRVIVRHVHKDENADVDRHDEPEENAPKHVAREDEGEAKHAPTVGGRTVIAAAIADGVEVVVAALVGVAALRALRRQRRQQ